MTNPAANTNDVDMSNGIPVKVFQDQMEGGHTRDKPVQQEVLKNVQEAVFRTLGKDYSVRVDSGGQEGDKRTGTRRHNEGGAADLMIYDKNGKQVSQDEYARVAQLYLAENMGSVGMQMSTGGVHFDKFKRGRKSTDPDALRGREGQVWNYNNKGGIPISDSTWNRMQEGVQGQLPEGAMSKEDFQASLARSKSTPTASLQGLSPDDRDVRNQNRRNSLPLYSTLTKSSVAKPTQALPNLTQDHWPGLADRITERTTPVQTRMNGNGAGDVTNKFRKDKDANAGQDTKVRVSDIPPIDEYKMTLANGSALV